MVKARMMLMIKLEVSWKSIDQKPWNLNQVTQEDGEWGKTNLGNAHSVSQLLGTCLPINLNRLILKVIKM